MRSEVGDSGAVAPVGVGQRVTLNTGVTVTVLAGFVMRDGSRVCVCTSVTVVPGCTMVLVSWSCVILTVVGGSVLVRVFTTVDPGTVCVSAGRVTVLGCAGTVTVLPAFVIVCAGLVIISPGLVMVSAGLVIVVTFPGAVTV